MVTDHKGFAEIQTPTDILLKLEHDLKRMTSDPFDSYAAFDFFVTAEHILDWIHPNNRAARKKIRESDYKLQIVSHLANGIKHFRATAKHHVAVEQVKKEEGSFSSNSFSSRSFDVGSFKISGLIVKKDDGEFIHATQLAEDVFKSWEKRLAQP